MRLCLLQCVHIPPHLKAVGRCTWRPASRFFYLADGSSQQPGDAAAAALASTVTDEDALKAHHRFLRRPEDEEGEQAGSWGARLARRYYARLFKEFAIADLSR